MRRRSHAFLHTLTPSVLGLVLCAPGVRAAGVSAFPGAEGFGAETPGGRGGRVIEVTNLDDNGPGSLRAAIESEGPRIIVFRIAGTIEVDTPLQVRHPFATIAGQSAPGGGITLKNSDRNYYAPLQVKTQDVVLRYLRFRPGVGGKPPPNLEGSNVDALTVADPERTVGSVVIDHCSLSWAVDEVFNSWYAASDITIQWCLFSEGLHFPKDRDSAGSKGVLLGGRGSDGISFHHNLLAHNVGRNPMIKTAGVVDLVNNVLFIPGTVGVVVDGELGRAQVNLVGNQLIAPDGDGLAYGVSVLGRRDVSLYVSGNLGPYRQRDDQPDVQFVDARNTSRQRLTDRRHAAPSVTTSPAAAAFTHVLEDAGCTRPMRDAVDERVIDDVRRGLTRIVSDPSEAGGWPELPAGMPPDDTDHDGMPDDWERRFALDPDDPADGPRDPDGDGYTNVEEFLNSTEPRDAP